ncbi:MAG: hypothetical protein QN194_15535 [Armatimonadota bacterium]|nr:hypothetical protein [Armatimonadota bacterium]
MEIRIPRILLPLLAAAAAVLLLFLLPRLSTMTRSRLDPDVETAIRAAEQIYAIRTGETYDALAPELAARYRQQAERLPAAERDRRVEILGAALVRRGDVSEVAVLVRATPNRAGAIPLESRAFFVVKGGKVIRVYPAMP